VPDAVPTQLSIGPFPTRCAEAKSRLYWHIPCRACLVSGWYCHEHLDAAAGKDYSGDWLWKKKIVFIIARKEIM